jgi:hypothetical protein
MGWTVTLCLMYLSVVMGIGICTFILWSLLIVGFISIVISTAFMKDLNNKGSFVLFGEKLNYKSLKESLNSNDFITNTTTLQYILGYIFSIFCILLYGHFGAYSLMIMTMINLTAGIPFLIELTRLKRGLK